MVGGGWRLVRVGSRRRHLGAERLDGLVGLLCRG